MLSEKKFIECVPNFSEGRNEETIKAIAQSIENIPHVALLNIESDADYNRTVATFVGEPINVLQAAIASTEVALERIDMERQKGEHPRIGAVDVVPFIPLNYATMDDCISLARDYGKIVAERFDVPVYLYEYAATQPHRKNLAAIRKGEYEGLPKKLNDPNWYPDFGKPAFNKKSGAIVSGARNILIAYNITLSTSKRHIAHEIALRIRERGFPLKDQFGNVQRDQDGHIITVPGSLRFVKAIGINLERLHKTQVSTNLINYKVTSLHHVFEEVKRQAELFNIDVIGSEIVGLVPLDALLQAGRFYSGNNSLSENRLVESAIHNLGLNYHSHFDPSQKIIEYKLQQFND